MCIWSTVASQLLVGLLAGLVGLLGGLVLAFFTQGWIEKREHRRWLADRRLELYLESIDLVLDNELALAERGAEGKIPPVEIQVKRIRISHRLALLGPHAVREAYKAYLTLVFQETAHGIEHRPEDPDRVGRARDHLIELIAGVVQNALRRWISGNSPESARDALSGPSEQPEKEQQP